MLMSKRTKAEIRAERDALLAAVEKAGKRGKPFPWLKVVSRHPAKPRPTA